MVKNPTVIRLDESKLSDAYVFLEYVFTREQQIPKHLIPPKSSKQMWWCIQNRGKIIATAAAWKINEEWHWGRLAVDPNERGYGLGKRITQVSFNELFTKDINEIIIDAREITVHLLKSFGAEITGKTANFYGDSITPMVLRSKSYQQKVRN